MKKIESVSAVEKALADLAAKRQAIVARAEEVGGRRKVLGFLSLVSNDDEATAELAVLNTEYSAIEGALSGLDDALSEGRNRLQLAKAMEASLANQADAQELAKQLDIFEAAGNEIDAALETLVSAPIK